MRPLNELIDRHDPDIEKIREWLGIAVNDGIRAEKNIAPSARVTAILTVGDDYKKTILEGYREIVAEQGRCAAVRGRRSGSTTAVPLLLGPVATAMAGDIVLLAPPGTEGTIERMASPVRPLRPD